MTERIIDAYEAELATLRARLLEREEKFVAKHAELATMRAENARLRSENKQEQEHTNNYMRLLHAAESRLADATELLARARDCQDDSEPFACEIDAFLATQPAAPRKIEKLKPRKLSEAELEESFDDWAIAEAERIKGNNGP